MVQVSIDRRGDDLLPCVTAKINRSRVSSRKNHKLAFTDSIKENRRLEKVYKSLNWRIR